MAVQTTKYSYYSALTSEQNKKTDLEILNDLKTQGKITCKITYTSAGPHNDITWTCVIIVRMIEEGEIVRTVGSIRKGATKAEAAQLAAHKVIEKMGKPAFDFKSSEIDVEHQSEKTGLPNSDNAEVLGKPTSDVRSENTAGGDKPVLPEAPVEACLNDEIYDLLRVWQRVKVMEWKSTDAAGTVLFTMNMSPFEAMETDLPELGEGDGMTEYGCTNLYYWGLLARQWSGHLKMMVDCVASMFHQGQLGICFTGPEDPLPTKIEDIFQRNPTMINLGDIQKQVFEVPNLSPYHSKAVGPKMDGRENLYFSSVMTVMVTMPLVNSSAVSDKIDINLEMAAADDFEYNIPTGVRADLEIETQNQDGDPYFLGMVTNVVEDLQIISDPAVEEVEPEVQSFQSQVESCVTVPTARKGPMSVMDETPIDPGKFQPLLVDTFDIKETSGREFKESVGLLTYFTKYKLLQQDMYSNFSYINTRWKVIVTVNGLPTNVGRVVVGATPDGTLSDMSSKTAFSTVRNLPHVEMSLNGTTSAEFEVPYWSAYPAIKTDTDEMSLGQLFIYVYNSLKVASGAPGTVPVNIYVQPVDTSLVVRKVFNSSATMINVKHQSEYYPEVERTEEHKGQAGEAAVTVKPDQYSGKGMFTFKNLAGRDHQIVRAVYRTDSGAEEISGKGRLNFSVPIIPAGQLYHIVAGFYFYQGSLGFKAVTSIGVSKPVQTTVRVRTIMEVISQDKKDNVDAVPKVIGKMETDENNYLGNTQSAIYQPGIDNARKTVVRQQTPLPLLKCRVKRNSVLRYDQCNGEIIYGSRATNVRANTDPDEVSLKTTMLMSVFQSAQEDMSVKVPLMTPLVRLKKKPGEELEVFFNRKAEVIDVKHQGIDRKTEVIDEQHQGGDEKGKYKCQQIIPGPLQAKLFDMEDFHKWPETRNDERHIVMINVDGVVSPQWREHDVANSNAVCGVYKLEDHTPLYFVSDTARDWVAGHLVQRNLDDLNINKLKNRLEKFEEDFTMKDLGLDGKTPEVTYKKKPVAEEEEEEPEVTNTQEAKAGIFRYMYKEIAGYLSKGVMGIKGVLTYLSESSIDIYKRFSSAARTFVLRKIDDFFGITDMIEGTKRIFKSLFYSLYAVRKVWLWLKGTNTFMDLLMDLAVVIDTSGTTIMEMLQKISNMKQANDTATQDMMGFASSIMFGTLGIKAAPSLSNEIKRITVMKAGVSAIDLLKKSLVGLWSWVIEGTDKEVMRRANQVLNDMEPEVNELSSTFRNLRASGRFSDGEIMRDDDCDALSNLQRSNNIVMRIRGPLEITGRRASWRKWCEEVEHEWGKYVKGKNLTKCRMEPVGIYLFGDPGTGKSYLMGSVIPELVMARTGHISKRSQAARQVYSIPNNPDQKYLDGYWGQAYTFYDDFMSNKEGKDINTMINYVSTASAPISMAHLEDKGMMFVSDFVAVSSNVGAVQVADKTHYTPTCLTRRFPVSYTVKVKPDYQLTHGTLNMPKVVQELQEAKTQTDELIIYGKAFNLLKKDIVTGAEAGVETPFHEVIDEIVNIYKLKKRTLSSSNNARMRLEYDEGPGEEDQERQRVEAVAHKIDTVVPTAATDVETDLRRYAQAAGFSGMIHYSMTARADTFKENSRDIIRRGGAATLNFSVIQMANSSFVTCRPGFIALGVKAIGTVSVEYPTQAEICKVIREHMVAKGMCDSNWVKPDGALTATPYIWTINEFIRAYKLAISGQKDQLIAFRSTVRTPDVRACIEVCQDKYHFESMNIATFLETLRALDGANTEQMLDILWLRLRGNFTVRIRGTMIVDKLNPVSNLIMGFTPTQDIVNYCGIGFCTYRASEGDDAVEFNRTLATRPCQSWIKSQYWLGLKVWAETAGIVSAHATIVKQVICIIVSIGMWFVVVKMLAALVNMFCSLFTGEKQGYTSTKTRFNKTPAQIMHGKQGKVNDCLEKNVVKLYGFQDDEWHFSAHALVYDQNHIICNNHVYKSLLKFDAMSFTCPGKNIPGLEYKLFTVRASQEMTTFAEGKMQILDAVVLRLSVGLQGFRCIKSQIITAGEIQHYLESVQTSFYGESHHRPCDEQRLFVATRTVMNKSTTPVSWSYAGKVSIPTYSGDCGIPVMTNSGKLFGIHDAYLRISTESCVTPMIREDIERAQADIAVWLEIDTLPIIVDNSFNNIEEAQPQGWDAPGLVCRGKLTLDEPVKVDLPMKTDKTLSTFANVKEWRDDHLPSVKSKSILYEQAQKYKERHAAPPEEWITEEFHNMWKKIIDAFPDRNQAPLSEWIVLNGDVDMNMSPLRIDTSAGYWNTISKGKSTFFERYACEETGKMYIYVADKCRTEVHPWHGRTLHAALHERRDYARSGYTYPYSFWTSQLKDEMRPTQKVKDKKTRVFECPPVDYTMECRRLLGGYTAWYRNHAGVTFHHTIGKEYEAVIPLVNDYLFEGGITKGLAIDYTKFDATIPSAAFQAFRDHIMYYYRDAPFEENYERMALLTELENTQHICGEYLLQSQKGNKSGNPMTDVFNSFVNTWIIFSVFAVEWNEVFSKPMTGGDFHKEVRYLVYGDDAVITVDPDFEKLIDIDRMTETVQSLGFIVTSADKVHEGLSWQDREDLSFLKRDFVEYVNAGVVCSPLPIEILYRELNWTRKSVKHDVEVKKAVLKDVLRKAFHLGKEVWDKLHMQILNAIQEDESLKMDPPQLETYGAISAMWWKKQQEANETAIVFVRNYFGYLGGNFDPDEYDHGFRDDFW